MMSFAHVILEMLKVTPEQIAESGMHDENVADIELKDFYASFAALSSVEEWNGKTYNQMFSNNDEKNIIKHGWKRSSFNNYATGSFLPWWEHCCLKKGLSTSMFRWQTTICALSAIFVRCLHIYSGITVINIGNC